MKNEKNLANVSSENLKNKTLHEGRKILYPDIEIQLVQFIGSRSDLDPDPRIQIHFHNPIYRIQQKTNKADKHLEAIIEIILNRS